MLSYAVGGALSPTRVKYSGALLEQFVAWRCVQRTAMPATLGYKGPISIQNRLLFQVFDIFVFVLLLNVFLFHPENNNKLDAITLSGKWSISAI